MSSLQRGQVIGDRFEVERLIGAGGMGVVYRAHDRESGGPVALKLLQSEQLYSEERFLREAEVLAELSHPAIVAYVSSGVADGNRPYIAMEWLEGETLWKRIDQRSLDIRDALIIGRRIGEALGAAHAVGVVHRDVKPSNVFLEGGRLDAAKLLDFGLARPYDNSHPLTVSGTVLGTPEYMAPEQVRGKTDLDPRTDVYGLGALLYRCIAGAPPFRASNLIAALAKVLVDDPPPLSSLVPGVPIGVEDLIHAMLSKEPAGRPRDAMMVVEEIERIQRHLDGKTMAAAGFDRGATRQIRAAKPATVILASGLSEERALQQFVAHAEGQGGKIERAMGGYAVITFDENGTLEDTALHRAEKTLHRLREAAPEAGLSLATIEESESAGGAIDRAASQLAETAKGRFADAAKAPAPMPRDLSPTRTLDPPDTPMRTPAFPDLTPALVVPVERWHAPVLLKLAVATAFLALAGWLAWLATADREPEPSAIARTPPPPPIVEAPPPAPAIAVLFLSTDPAGATVTMRGEPQGITPVVLRLSPGPAAIELHKEGWEKKAIELELVPGSERVLSEKLEPIETKKRERKKRTRTQQPGLKPNPFGK